MGVREVDQQADLLETGAAQDRPPQGPFVREVLEPADVERHDRQRRAAARERRQHGGGRGERAVDPLGTLVVGSAPAARVDADRRRHVARGDPEGAAREAVGDVLFHRCAPDASCSGGSRLRAQLAAPAADRRRRSSVATVAPAARVRCVAVVSTTRQPGGRKARRRLDRRREGSAEPGRTGGAAELLPQPGVGKDVELPGKGAARSSASFSIDAAPSSNPRGIRPVTAVAMRRARRTGRAAGRRASL